MSPANTNRATGFAALLVTALGWGFGWLAMKVVLQSWPPLFGRGAAGLIAAMLLALVALMRGERLAVPRGARARLAMAAFTNVFAWMGFSSLSLRWITVSEAALLVYSMPVWATLFAWAVLGHRPTLRGFLALALGLSGIGVLLGAGGGALGAEKLPGIGFALAAAVLFALGAVLNSRALPVPPFAMTAWQVGLGCLPMVVLGITLERPAVMALSSASAWAFVYVTLIPMAACFLTWFEALRRLPPVAASTSMLLVPLIGILSATLFLSEPLGPREMLAMALTLGGVVLALRK
ncbi:DMT family transporter [Methylobacterium sp.]|uniref:DMT family transporter n=1 Tax=Methylobacterium sp. TaxID=409 RepID=UPI000FC03D89|nr:DMT family transporter [Methylobacterium sp.]RUP22776.1 MAG: DMT family transporter [Methylobacterium sp.]